MARRTIAELISVADLAEMQKIHVKTARDRLKQLERQRAGTIIWIGRQNSKRKNMYTTLGLIKQADARFLEEREISQDALEELEREAAKTKEENARLKSRVRTLEALKTDFSASQNTVLKLSERLKYLETILTANGHSVTNPED